jgi:hypothetical protein
MPLKSSCHLKPSVVMIKKLGASFVAVALLFCAFNCNTAKHTIIITKGNRFILFILSMCILNLIRLKLRKFDGFGCDDIIKIFGGNRYKA